MQITPGAGGMYCGNCFRDNALVAEWRRQGHQALMVPLYLPLKLDEEDQSAGTPVFFGGLNVFLEQQFPWLQNMPRGLRRLLASPALLRWAAGRAAKTRASEVGDMTVSMLQGEEGRQRCELEDLVGWLKERGQLDMICLSNALLLGLAPRLKRELQTRLACQLTGEDSFLDGLPEPHRSAAWRLVQTQARVVDVFISPSRWFAQVMAERLQLPPERIQVVPLGLNLEGYPPAPAAQFSPPVIGFFARMCREKGLPVLVDAFVQLRQRGKAPPARLKIGGGCGPSDEPVVEEQKRKLAQAGLLGEVAFHANVSREEKIAFFKGLTLFSVPVQYNQSFGMFLLEAMAAGVPVVQPATAAFPEIVEATGGGVIAAPRAEALAEAMESLLLDRVRWEQLARAAHRAVHTQYAMPRVARMFLEVVGQVRAA
ncbi:glycosyltransferase family 4 protein [Fontisphaera persica]|uniref:glycosyltransferase family 4 protein n=1 Tax=Fontisphaera persica TaxID=2974023 RepID=UPI0024C09B62|nr:glycosyltransferase family 4 protein [Fontisphaera persica]WCJ61015.1 glycosyltransferase family 4 protein [Fontisphaera persica]